MTTYGDMVTLILTFFILLYSFSEIDVVKFRKLLSSFRGAIGVMDGGKTTQEDSAAFSGQTMVDSGESRKQSKDILEVARKIQVLINQEGLQKSISVSVTQRGVVISVSEGILFLPGQMELNGKGKRILFKVGEVLKVIPNDIAVEGHADDSQPSRATFVRDNWGLSSIRASRIVAYLQEKVGFPSKRLQAVGLGDSRPLMPNDSALHRSMNRRAEIIVLSMHESR
jgi:chemotaxis protein MotB